jgi:hypothetical protein
VTAVTPEADQDSSSPFFRKSYSDGRGLQGEQAVDRGNGRYAAFLSYSHKDAAAARWLHRRLETYRIPKRLAGGDGEWGPVPARLTPIFRDREELPAAGDLSERVRAALALSDNLVILCSPAAAASLWVAKEIAAFRELHPGRPVFAAIVEGDPPLCFPPSLAAGGAEPLAADLRPGRDGRRLGFLKLVAGLSGTGLGALVQRDAQRRIRRVTAVTAAALAAMLVMVVMTGIALSERREAQRQRAEAEGLVEFMLTDLRTKLRSVDRLDIMEAVNARALQRYGRADELKDLPDDALSRRARILHSLGEDELALGDVTKAETVFREAYRTTADQLSRHPNDRVRQFDHARSDYFIGRVHELRREWPAAQHQYALFASGIESLVRQDPKNPKYLKEAAWSAVDLGNVQLNGLGNPATAQRYYEIAVRRFSELAGIRPNDDELQRDLANAYAWLGDSYFFQDLPHQSLSARLKQLPIVARLVRNDPRNVEDVFRYALAQRAIERVYLKLGNRKIATPLASAAYRLSINLTNYDPRNADWLLFRGVLDCDILFGPLQSPNGTTNNDLKRDVKSVEVQLSALHDPRLRDIGNCVRALS